MEYRKENLNLTITLPSHCSLGEETVHLPAFETALLLQLIQSSQFGDVAKEIEDFLRNQSSGQVS